jgi:hypothetical protein
MRALGHQLTLFISSLQLSLFQRNIILQAGCIQPINGGVIAQLAVSEALIDFRYCTPRSTVKLTLLPARTQDCPNPHRYKGWMTGTGFLPSLSRHITGWILGAVDVVEAAIRLGLGIQLGVVEQKTGLSHAACCLPKENNLP